MPPLSGTPMMIITSMTRTPYKGGPATGRGRRLRPVFGLFAILRFFVHFVPILQLFPNSQNPLLLQQPVLYCARALIPCPAKPDQRHGPAQLATPDPSPASANQLLSFFLPLACPKNIFVV